ncbi:AP-3 complex subunit sigma-2 [Taenia solium]|eukprot:TsM_000010700 transcript=TsM_000010700 gene=TsM_000010700
MIRAVLIFNNSGKPRLMKFYDNTSEELQQKLLSETFLVVSKRDDNVCNFLEGGSVFSEHDCRIIYRHYATLYFVFCVDATESELGILDLIQVFVEALDKSFESVCELDLIFHSDKVHFLLNELIIGGMVLETHISEIIYHNEEQNKLEKQESTLPIAPSRAVSAVKDLKIAQKLKDIKLPEIPYLNSRIHLT